MTAPTLPVTELASVTGWNVRVPLSEVPPVIPYNIPYSILIVLYVKGITHGTIAFDFEYEWLAPKSSDRGADCLIFIHSLNPLSP